MIELGRAALALALLTAIYAAVAALIGRNGDRRWVDSSRRAVYALCALVIMVPRSLQGRGLSAFAVRAMLELARRHGLGALIAPVRPSWKERYPLVPIERYAGWRRADGLLFDPWMRVHERLGASVLKPEPQSLHISGTVAEWEEWTRMVFPGSGEYWFPGGLATLRIDRDAGRGVYWEPNVWMHHAP